MKPNKLFGDLMRKYRDKIKIKVNGKKCSISREQVARRFRNKKCKKIFVRRKV